MHEFNKRETGLEDSDNINKRSFALNRNETVEIQDFGRKRRIAIMRNNLILVAILNFLTISGLLCCLIFYKWFHMGNLWVGLLYLLDETDDNFYKTSDYLTKLHCEESERNECEILKRFFLSGRICTAIFIFGLVLHLIYFGQIIFLALKRVNNPDNYAIKIFKPLIFKILSMISYIFCIIFWAFFNKTYEVEGKIGVALYAGMGACSLYLILLIYYGVLKREIAKSRIIENLLNVDRFVGNSFSEPQPKTTVGAIN